jgi:hypothetical protein
MPLDIENTSISSQTTPTRIVVLSDVISHSDALIETFKLYGHTTAVATFPDVLSQELRNLVSTVDLVLVDLTSSSHRVIERLERIRAAVGIRNLRPRLLCFSTAHRNPDFVLSIEKCGLRYFRVGSPQILLEMIDLTLTELNDLEVAHGVGCFSRSCT